MLRLACSPGIVLRAHPCPFRAKLLLLGFSPATETLKATFSLWLLAETQMYMSKWAAGLQRVDPRESITPSVVECTELEGTHQDNQVQLKSSSSESNSFFVTRMFFDAMM